MGRLSFILFGLLAVLVHAQAHCPAVANQVHLATVEAALLAHPPSHPKVVDAVQNALKTWKQVASDLSHPTTSITDSTPAFSGNWGPEASPMNARELLTKVQSGEIHGVFFSGAGEFEFSSLRGSNSVYLAAWMPTGLQLFVMTRYRRIIDGQLAVHYTDIRGTNQYQMVNNSRAWGLAIRLGWMAGFDLSRSFQMPQATARSPAAELIAQRQFLQLIHALLNDRDILWAPDAYSAVRSALNGSRLLGFKPGELGQFYIDHNNTLSRVYFADGEFRIDSAVEHPEAIIGAETRLAVFPYAAPTVGRNQPVTLAAFKNQLRGLLDQFPRATGASRWPAWSAVSEEARRINDLVDTLFGLLDAVPDGDHHHVISEAIVRLVPPAWARNTLQAMEGARSAPISQSQLASRLRLIAEYGRTDPTPAIRAESLSYWIDHLRECVPDAVLFSAQDVPPGERPFEAYRNTVFGHLIELAFFLDDPGQYRMGGQIDGMLFQFRRRFRNLLGTNELQALADALAAEDLLKRDADLIRISAEDHLLHGLVEVKSGINDLGRLDDLIAQLQRLAQVIEIMKQHGLMHANAELTLALWRAPTQEVIDTITARMHAVAPNVRFRVQVRTAPATPTVVQPVRDAA